MSEAFEPELDIDVLEEMELEKKFKKPCEKCEEKDKVGCSAVGYQDVNVCIPVKIIPFGEAGNAKTQCIGKAVINSDCDYCPGKTDGVCKFTISQKLRVEVPVIFGARAEVGEASIECKCAESDSE